MMTTLVELKKLLENFYCLWAGCLECLTVFWDSGTL